MRPFDDIDALIGRMHRRLHGIPEPRGRRVARWWVTGVALVVLLASLAWCALRSHVEEPDRREAAVMATSAPIWIKSALVRDLED